jgi:hypothetical protein
MIATSARLPVIEPRKPRSSRRSRNLFRLVEILLASAVGGLAVDLGLLAAGDLLAGGEGGCAPVQSRHGSEQGLPGALDGFEAAVDDILGACLQLSSAIGQQLLPRVEAALPVIGL